MRSVKKYLPCSLDAGFTLLELSISLIISAFITIMIILLLQNYEKNINNEAAKQGIQNARNAMDRFYTQFARYPCPADPTLLAGDPKFGQEDCALAPIAGMRDTDGNGTFGDGPDQVLVGTFPAYGFNDINGNGIVDPVEESSIVYLSGFNEADKFANANFSDPWGHQLTYAVTKPLTVPAGDPNNPPPFGTAFDNRLGAIEILDEYDHDTGGIIKDAQYVIISHGPDGIGAAPSTSSLNAIPCNAAYTNEAENCNGDAKFRASLKYLNDGDPTKYYDDYISFYKNAGDDIWSQLTSGVVGMTNRNTGNVGVKNPTPEYKLDVRGNILVEGYNFQSQICGMTNAMVTPPTTSPYSPTSLTSADETCLNPGSIYDQGTPADPRVGCPQSNPLAAPKYMTGIQFNTDASGYTYFKTTGCQTPTIVKPAVIENCSSGYLRGIKTDGTVVCWQPPTP